MERDNGIVIERKENLSQGTEVETYSMQNLRSIMRVENHTD